MFPLGNWASATAVRSFADGDRGDRWVLVVSTALSLIFRAGGVHALGSMNLGGFGMAGCSPRLINSSEDGDAARRGTSDARPSRRNSATHRTNPRIRNCGVSGKRPGWQSSGLGRFAFATGRWVPGSVTPWAGLPSINFGLGKLWA